MGGPSTYYVNDDIPTGTTITKFSMKNDSNIGESNLHAIVVNMNP